MVNLFILLLVASLILAVKRERNNWCITLLHLLHMRWFFYGENEMKMKMGELNEVISNLRMMISSLEERITKEERDKLP